MGQSTRARACERQDCVGRAALTGLLAVLSIQQAVHFPGCESRKADKSHLHSWTVTQWQAGHASASGH